MVQRNMPDTPTLPEAEPPSAPYVVPPLGAALWRGLRNRCPICGQGRVFNGYLRVVDECAVCTAPLGTLRADDAPPYFTIFIVGHLFLPPVFWVEKAYAPPMWFYWLIGIPLFGLMTGLLLRPVKGATVGLMARLNMGPR
jgi:uncharacterized protein (DUF983 family)